MLHNREFCEINRFHDNSNFFLNNKVILYLILRRPLRRKLRMRWFFDISKEKESKFLKSDLNDPPSDF